MNKILFIGLVWPEPTSSAAGVRIIQLLKSFRPEENEIIFASAASKTPHSFDLTQLGVKSVDIELNASSFDVFVSNFNPSVVLYDRYISEEQYSWRVKEQCPDALHILDTEDLHFLRKAREQAIKQSKLFSLDLCFTDITKRELASILRSDVSLIISKFEMNLLQNQFKVDTSSLLYLPLWIDNSNHTYPQFEDREGFMFIGNFIHEPNWDAVLQLKKVYWPIIRKQIPTAKLHIYGAYTSEKVFQLHNEKEGFRVEGRAESVEIACLRHRVMLAPLRFGAGVKGKLIDALHYGLPSVTTEIGIESLIENKTDWGGVVSTATNEFCEGSVELYTNQTSWESAVKKIDSVKSNNEQFKDHGAIFYRHILQLKNNLFQHRQANFISSVLSFQLMQGTKFMSKWIELKKQIEKAND
jgi:glycosyltransferase involved in cell wall biosynthesis